MLNAGPCDIAYRLVDGTLTVWVADGLAMADDDTVRTTITPTHTKWVMSRAALAPQREDTARRFGSPSLLTVSAPAVNLVSVRDTLGPYGL